MPLSIWEARHEGPCELCERRIRPGDEVTIHGAPIRVAFGDRVNLRRTATVVRAGVLRRMLTRFAGYFELTELYEVSFSDGRAA